VEASTQGDIWGLAAFSLAANMDDKELAERILDDHRPCELLCNITQTKREAGHSPYLDYSLFTTIPVDYHYALTAALACELNSRKYDPTSYIDVFAKAIGKTKPE
jgi:hypothetical protein